MFFLNGKQKIMVLARHQIALSISATNPANLPELYFSMASRLDETAHRLGAQLKCAELQGNSREEEALRLVLTFDVNHRLSDQSGYYFPGLKGMLRTGHPLSGLAFQEEPKIEHLFSKQEESAQIKRYVDQIQQRKQPEKFIMNTHRLELHPLSGLGSKEPPGFQLIIHRKESLTLSFLVARTMASRGGKGLSIASEDRRRLLEELGTAKTLLKSVSLFGEYVHTVFGVSLDKLSAYFKKESSSSSFDIDPDLLQSNVGEYFEQEQKRKRVIMKFQQAVHVKVLQKKGSGVHNTSGPSQAESSLLKQADLDFLEREKTQTFRLCWLMFEDWDLPRTFNFTEDKFILFLLEAQRLYDQHKNPFHNFAHGMTVLHQTYYMLRVTRLSKFFESIGKIAILFAGLMHDVDHRGRTNAFEQNSLSDIAIMHNDRSILENHHCSTAFQLVRQQKFNFLDKLTTEQFMEFRKVVIESILATDVKRHFEIIDAFTKRLEDKDFSPTPDSPADHVLLCGMVTHTCDLYVPTRKLADAIKWSALVNKEFMEQNKEEKLKGLPEVPFYKNLDQPKILANSEKFFVDKIVSPLWNPLNIDCSTTKSKVRFGYGSSSTSFWKTHNFNPLFTSIGGSGGLNEPGRGVSTLQLQGSQQQLAPVQYGQAIVQQQGIPAGQNSNSQHQAPGFAFDLSSEARNTARALMQRFDTNRSGYLEGPELESMIREVHQLLQVSSGITSADGQSLGQVLDVNRDGRVCLNDVEAFVIKLLK